MVKLFSRKLVQSSYIGTQLCNTGVAGCVGILIVHFEIWYNSRQPKLSNSQEEFLWKLYKKSYWNHTVSGDMSDGNYISHPYHSDLMNTACLAALPNLPNLLGLSYQIGFKKYLDLIDFLWFCHITNSLRIV